MRQKNQILIFNDSELALIKAVFADNEELLYAVRNVLLQFPLTKDERKLIKGSVNAEVYAIIKKRVFPDASSDSPFTQVGDFYQTLTKRLNELTVEEMTPIFDAAQLEIDYLNQQFEVLKNIEGDVPETIRLADLATLKGKTPYQRYVDTTARNFLLGFIDPMLNLLKSIAGQKQESVEEVKKRVTRDSSK